MRDTFTHTETDAAMFAADEADDYMTPALSDCVDVEPGFRSRRFFARCPEGCAYTYDSEMMFEAHMRLHTEGYVIDPWAV